MLYGNQKCIERVSVTVYDTKVAVLSRLTRTRAGFTAIPSLSLESHVHEPNCAMPAQKLCCRLRDEQDALFELQ